MQITSTLILAASTSLLVVEASTALAEKSQVADAIKVFDAWVAARIEDRELPGLSIAIISDQELVWAKGYGYADVEKKIPTTPATTYRIASITKTFTAHAVMLLRDDGKLGMDDPVAKWIPDLKLAGSDTNGLPLTLRQLLTHTGGVPCEVEGNYWNDLSLPSRETVLPLLNKVGLVWEAEKEWKYSNVGLALVGDVIASASGQTYSMFVSNRILAPLEMSGTRVKPDSALLSLAKGYGRRVPGKSRRVIPFLDAGYMQPAGGMASSVQDLAKYVSLQFRKGPAGGSQILKGATLAEMQRVHWLQPDWKSGWGLGWEINRVGQMTHVGHGGTVPGFRSQLTMIPSEKFGVVVLVNADDGQPNQVADQACALLAPAISNARSPSSDVAKEQAAALQKYVGLYEAEEDKVRVEVLNGVLTFFSPSEDDPLSSKVTLEFIGEDLFRMKDGFQAGETARFIKNPEGEVSRLQVPGYHLVRSRR